MPRQQQNRSLADLTALAGLTEHYNQQAQAQQVLQQRQRESQIDALMKMLALQQGAQTQAGELEARQRALEIQDRSATAEQNWRDSSLAQAERLAQQKLAVDLLDRHISQGGRYETFPKSLAVNLPEGFGAEMETSVMDTAKGQIFPEFDQVYSANLDKPSVVADYFKAKWPTLTPTQQKAALEYDWQGRNQRLRGHPTPTPAPRSSSSVNFGFPQTEGPASADPKDLFLWLTGQQERTKVTPMETLIANRPMI